ncbi:MAG: PIG-L deacetylase family protein [Nitrososphaera sp.]
MTSRNVVVVFCAPKDVESCKRTLARLSEAGNSVTMVFIGAPSQRQRFLETAELMALRPGSLTVSIAGNFDYRAVTQQNVKTLESAASASSGAGQSGNKATEFDLAIIPSAVHADRRHLVAAKSSLLAFRKVPNVLHYPPAAKSPSRQVIPVRGPEKNVICLNFERLSAGTHRGHDALYFRRLYEGRPAPQHAEREVFQSQRLVLNGNSFEESFQTAAISDMKNSAGKMKILAVGAHPDDIEIGCGGTMSMHKQRGDSTHGLLCTLGGVRGDPQVRRDEAYKAAETIGFQLEILDIPVEKLNQPGAEVTKIFGRILARLRPDRIYVHSINDNHQVHVSISSCVTDAALSMDALPQIMHYETISSTTTEFRPNAFTEISAFIDVKTESINAHVTQADRFYLQPGVIRSLANTRYVWGKVGPNPDGLAEAFSIVALPL